MPMKLQRPTAKAASAASAASAEPAIRVYFLEVNRCLHDASRRFIRRLQRSGLVVVKLPHKTAYRIERPADIITFMQMKRALALGLNPQLGSVILFSATTGNAWVMSNRGNRPGVFQPV